MASTVVARPIVSILMTTYNREKYVEAAIKSVMASTYQNFELIVSDDGSTDATVQIVRSFEKLDPRIRLFINEQNLGDYQNRNKAASYASGKYLKYVDADDYLYPWGLDILVRLMEEHDSAGWGLCSLVQIKDMPYPVLLSPRDAYLHNYFVSPIFEKSPLSSIIKRETFLEVGGFKPLRMVGDFEMWHRLALDFPVLLMPDGIVWYREHDDQEINHYDKFAMQYDSIVISYLKNANCPIGYEDRKAIIRQSKRRIKKSIVRNMITGRFGKLTPLIKRLSVYYAERL